jgi:riboflavin transporter
MTLNYFTRLSVLLALTFVMQLSGFSQPITGTLVNFMLILTTQFLGIAGALILGTLTPLVALLIGQLPAILMIMIPFIILANWIIVIIFGVLSKKEIPFLKTITGLQNVRKIVSVLMAAFCKFIFLVISVKGLLPVIFDYQINEKIVYMMMFPQLFTALAGGLLAVFIFSLLVKIKYFSELFN